jgi:hypothetical protein
LDQDTVETAALHWGRIVENRVSLTAHGKDGVRKLIKQFGVDLVLRAMREAVDSYCERDEKGEYTKESIDHAYSKLRGVARVLRDSAERPYLKQLFYIRGILRNRLNYVDDRLVISLMEECAQLNVDLDDLERIAKTTRNWSSFRSVLDRYIAEHKAQE